MSSDPFSPFCLATVVTHKAMDSLLEISGRGSYRDTHPWLVAKDMLDQSQAEGLQLALLFACQHEDKQVSFTHWSTVTQVDVVELHRGEWESRCHFGALHDMNPIWSDISSVFVKPSDEQLRREQIENIRVFRTELDEHHIHPYAICETPPFILGNFGN